MFSTLYFWRKPEERAPYYCVTTKILAGTFPLERAAEIEGVAVEEYSAKFAEHNAKASEPRESLLPLPHYL